MTGWTLEGEPAHRTGGVTLVEGSSFAVSDRRGDMQPGAAQGVFFRDTRIVSTWRLLVEGEPVEALTVLSAAPFTATFVGLARVRGSAGEPTLVVERRRYVGAGLREDITVRSFSRQAVTIAVDLEVDADFADLFEVKEGLLAAGGRRRVETGDGEIRIALDRPGGTRGVVVTGDGGRAETGRLRFEVTVPARREWSTTVHVATTVDGVRVPSRFPVEHPVEHAAPARDLRSWRRDAPRVLTSWAPLANALARSERDLGALRIVDPDHPDVSVVAAGAPWFMTVFGRDSLIASWMTLPFNQQLALGTLHTLARYQGRTVDPATEEEPGRILHEMRFGADASLALGGGNVYYGTADATPLFVVLLGELRRWGLGGADVDALLPAADAALAWVERYGDADGDGFVEYLRKTDKGLANQGWKDSYDGVSFADGTLAEPPIALAEVQGYTYAAFVARAHFAHEAGDEDGFARWAGNAAALKERFNREFWLPERGWYAMALDRDKRPVDALASNMGHCLWTGIVDEDKAAAVAQRLLSPEMFSGFGVRTLATSMGAYNPASYHNGSVWPHDNALTVSGLMRYGFVREAQRVAVVLLEAAERFDGRLPELFCGFDRAEYPEPVPYPTSCSPQAWAAATPVQLLRTLLRLDPWVPHGKVWLAPAFPEECADVVVEGLPLGDSRLTIEVRDGEWTVSGLGTGIELVRAPRRPLSAALPSAH